MGQETVRLRIELAYEGSGFFGWARQTELRTVQGEIESALSKVLHLNGRRRQDAIPETAEVAWTPRLVVAGRTDTGVHAAHQVCHVDVPTSVLNNVVGHMNLTPVAALERRLQHVLPADIAVHSVAVASPGFDARFSALDRTYMYRVCEDPSKMDPRLRSFVLPINAHLDILAMNTAAEAALGLHDFGSFAIANEGGTTIRKVKYAHWDRVISNPLISPSDGQGAEYQTPIVESGLVCFTIVADAFARNMVRSLVNALLKVGMGKRDIEWFRNKIEIPMREGHTGPIAACGLTLEHVAYPPDDQLAIRAESIKSKRTLP